VGWKRIFGLALASLALALVVWGLFSAKISIDVAPPQESIAVDGR
jgi:hypothetical protein